MHITAEVQSFREAFQTASAICNARQKPILGNVKLAIRGGQSELTSTDEQVSIIREVACDSKGDGELLLPATRINAILKEATSEFIEISETGEKLAVKCGGAKFQIATEPPVTFPTIKGFGERENFYRFVASDFKRMVRRTIFACDQSDKNVALSGVLFDIPSGTVATFAATDSRRCPIATGAVARVGNPETVRDVVPQKSLAEIVSAIPDDGSYVDVCFDGPSVLVRCDTTTIIARLAEGRFPPYQKIIPTKFDRTATIVCGPYFAALRQSMIVQSKESTGLTFAMSPGLLTLTTTTEHGNSVVEVPISYDGEPYQSIFGSNILADICRFIPPETPIEVGIGGPKEMLVMTFGSDKYLAVPFGESK